MSRAYDIAHIIKDQTGKSVKNQEFNNIYAKAKELEIQIDNLIDSLNNIMKTMLDNELAVVTGVCDFPLSCNQRKTCKAIHCSADVCNNGFAYRMS